MLLPTIAPATFPNGLRRPPQSLSLWSLVVDQPRNGSLQAEHCFLRPNLLAISGCIVTTSMTATSYTSARENLATTMDEVCEDCAPVIITRSRKPAVVLMSLKEYESLEETAYLLRSPANAKRMDRAIRQLDGR
jgi:antitoxin YefM